MISKLVSSQTTTELAKENTLISIKAEYENQPIHSHSTGSGFRTDEINNSDSLRQSGLSFFCRLIFTDSPGTSERRAQWSVYFFRQMYPFLVIKSAESVKRTAVFYNLM